jgi:putative hydrolase of the HAD superfamily
MIRLVIFDWGDTVMRETDFNGKMVDAPHVEAMPGIQAVLEALHPAYRLVMASNAQASAPPDIFAALRRVGLDGYFERAFASSVMGVAKPSPDFFLAVVRDCGVLPGEAVNIGDTFEKDIVGAKQAGLCAVWYNWKNATLPPGIAIRPDATIHDHAETVAAIRALDGF